MRGSAEEMRHTGGRHAGEGWIEVVCGGMFSGKTEELIRRLKRAEFAKQKVRIFKPAIDTRYHEEAVVSHDARVINSVPVKTAREILDHIEDAEVIGIDEAQFFDEQLPFVCNQLANKGIRVVAAGLDMDYRGLPFGPMPHLMAIAEYVTKVHAICVRTGALASYSHRIAGGNSQVELGEKDRYEPLSRKAFLEALDEDERNRLQGSLFEKDKANRDE